MFSQKGVEASKKNQKQNTANQIAPEISLKLFKVKVLQVFFICSTETFETCEYV